MSRLLRAFLVMVAVSFFVSVSYAAAKKPAGPGGGGGEAKVTTELSKITGNLSSSGAVEVGIEVKTYGPNILLTFSPSLLGYDYEGTYEGAARVLKKDGRLDFYFDLEGDHQGCGAPQFKSNDNVCPYALILLDGIYDRKADTVYFGPPARVYLYNAVLGEVVGKTMGEAESVTVDFEPYDN